MFVWFRVDGVADTQELIQKRAVDRKVILVPGASIGLPSKVDDHSDR